MVKDVLDLLCIELLYFCLFDLIFDYIVHVCFTGSKFISKSEDNLLTPQCDSTDHRSVWNGDTPDVGLNFPTDSFSETPMSSCRSEPALDACKPPTVSSVPKILCDGSTLDSFSEERSNTGPTLLKIKQAFGESGSDLHSIIQQQNHDEPQDNLGSNSEAVSSDVALPSETAHKSMSESEHNVTFGQIEIAPLSPLHIDSALFDSRPTRFGETSLNESLWLENESRDFLKEATECSADCSQLIDALDIQSPVAFRLDTSNRVQSTPYAARTQTNANASLPSELKESLLVNKSEADNSQNHPNAIEMRRIKVAEQIKLFNMMTLNSPKAKVVRSPLKFQRTPVRQSVRRINSLVGSRKDVRMGWCAASPMKAVSLESTLHSIQQPTFAKPKPPVPPKNPVKNGALEDVTNKAPKTKCNTLSANKNAADEHPKSVLLQVSENDTSRYRGSPKNPLAEVKLMSALKPIDL